MSQRERSLHLSSQTHSNDISPQSAERLDLAESLLGKNVCEKLGIYPLPQDFLLSVVIPVYNEVATVALTVDRVRATRIPCEIILIDDGSTDGTSILLESWKGQEGLVIEKTLCNEGKGAALKIGFTRARGDVVVVQDADLEYNPDDLWCLLLPIVKGEADVVFGTRMKSGQQRVLYFWHYVGNKILTLLSNLKTQLNLSDMETGYKLFRREIIQQIAPTLREKRFGIEPELTAKVARIPGIRVYELPISYHGRTYAQGKKIGWRDAVRAVWCTLRY
jgi:glycosyltransferase involved in cell wall biosynthesis